jgi:prophage maintenance system killer protein
MSNVNRSSQESYSESEAAAALGISISRLHDLLDKHVFTAGNKRPQSIDFTASDLLLLGYWNTLTQPPASKVIAMPRRR